MSEGVGGLHDITLGLKEGMNSPNTKRQGWSVA